MAWRVSSAVHLLMPQCSAGHRRSMKAISNQSQMASCIMFNHTCVIIPWRHSADSPAHCVYPCYFYAYSTSVSMYRRKHRMEVKQGSSKYSSDEPTLWLALHTASYCSVALYDFSTAYSIQLHKRKYTPTVTLCCPWLSSEAVNQRRLRSLGNLCQIISDLRD